jgi:preprotein translocase subunit SecA
MLGSLCEKSGETPDRVRGRLCRRGDDGRSQSLLSTEAAQAVRGAESKAVPREGG